MSSIKTHHLHSADVISYPKYILINNNNHDDIYSAVIIAETLQDFTRFMRWIQDSARWPPTFGPSQSDSAADLSIY